MSEVVVAPPRNVARPNELNVPAVAKAPVVAVVVAKPFTKKLPVVESMVVEAVVSVESPVTESVPSVCRLVLMVVAA